MNDFEPLHFRMNKISNLDFVHIKYSVHVYLFAKEKMKKILI